MRCASCGFANPEGMKFCGQCAAPLQHPCPQCGFEIRPDSSFAVPALLRSPDSRHVRSLAEVPCSSWLLPGRKPNGGS